VEGTVSISYLFVVAGSNCFQALFLNTEVESVYTTCSNFMIL
jgi:hypothetical protein